MVNQVLLELSLAKISVGTWFNRWSFYFYFVNLLWKKYTPSSHKISILSRCHNAVCSLPKTENFQIPLLLLVGVIIGDLFFTIFLCTSHLWHKSLVWFWWQCQWLLCSKCSLPKTETFKFPCCCWVGGAISASGADAFSRWQEPALTSWDPQS